MPLQFEGAKLPFCKVVVQHLLALRGRYGPTYCFFTDTYSVTMVTDKANQNISTIDAQLKWAYVSLK